MCQRLVFAAAVAALSLSACLDLESRWRWNGISVEDEAALHKITSSPIVLVHPDCGRFRYGNGDTGAVAKTPPAVVATLDLPIIMFGAFNPHQTLLPTN